MSNGYVLRVTAKLIGSTYKGGKMFEVYVVGTIGAACIVWVGCLEYNFWEDE